jgi:hypothetical protein
MVFPGFVAALQQHAQEPDGMVIRSGDQGLALIEAIGIEMRSQSEQSLQSGKQKKIEI